MGGRGRVLADGRPIGGEGICSEGAVEDRDFTREGVEMQVALERSILWSASTPTMWTSVRSL